MKTQVLHLDSHDDLTSIRDKISWAKAQRVLLVFPRRLRLVSRPLDLRILQRHAAALGTRIAIVARSDQLRLEAKELGIPIFASPTVAQRESWDDSGPRKPRRRHPRPDLREARRLLFPPEASWRRVPAVQVAFFILALLAVLALALLFVPSATIELAPATRLQTLTVPVSASLEMTTVNLAGSLPARTVSSVVSGSKTAPATGTAALPDTRASGTVRFRNLTETPVILPPGTVVLTTGSSPVRFATTAEVYLPAGVGIQGEASIEAVEPGSSGNLPADSLVAIEGDLGASLSVTNPKPTKGGTDRTAPIQTANDRASLRTALVDELLAQCRQALPGMLASDDLYFPSTLETAQVLSESYFPAEGQAGETLSLTMSLQCRAQYAAAADIQSLSILSLDASLPDGFVPASGNTAILSATAPVTGEDGVTRWEVTAQRPLRARLDPLSVTVLVLGRRPVDAARLIQDALPLSAPAAITVQPDWWPWLPGAPFRITVIEVDG